MKQFMSKISSKGQTTIPQEVRESLQARPGDLLQYTIENGKVIIRKFTPDDVLFLKGMQAQLSEWQRSEDDDLI